MASGGRRYAEVLVERGQRDAPRGGMLRARARGSERHRRPDDRQPARRRDPGACARRARLLNRRSRAGRDRLEQRRDVASPRHFDVELETGERLSGSIFSPSPGQLAVTAGTAPAAFETEAVVRITPIAATPAERTSGYVDFGLDFLTANDELDLKVDAEAENVMRNYVTTLSIDSIVSEVDDETAQRRNYFQIRSRRLLRERWFAIGRLHIEEDRELDLDARTLLGFGGGRTVLQSNRAVVALYGGLAADRERYRGVPGREDSAEAFVTVEWDWFELGGDTQVSTNATTYFSFD